MSNGLDQFLAIRLTSGTVMQVVTDPQKADAILTDRIGASFEEKLGRAVRQEAKAKEDDDDVAKPACSRAPAAVARFSWWTGKRATCCGASMSGRRARRRTI